MRFSELLFKDNCFPRVCAERKRKEAKIRKLLHKLAQLLQEILFFASFPTEVNKSFKCFLVELCGRQEEGEISAFLSSALEKNALRNYVISSQKQGFFGLLSWKTPFFFRRGLWPHGKKERYFIDWYYYNKLQRGLRRRFPFL